MSCIGGPLWVCVNVKLNLDAKITEEAVLYFCDDVDGKLCKIHSIAKVFITV